MDIETELFTEKDRPIPDAKKKSTDSIDDIVSIQSKMGPLKLLPKGAADSLKCVLEYGF